MQVFGILTYDIFVEYYLKYAITVWFYLQILKNNYIPYTHH